jgi:hypothetical protein
VQHAESARHILPLLPLLPHRHAAWRLADVAHMLRASHARYHGLNRPAALLMPVDQLLACDSSAPSSLSPAAPQPRAAVQELVLGQLAQSRLVLAATLDAGHVPTSTGNCCTPLPAADQGRCCVLPTLPRQSKASSGFASGIGLPLALQAAGFCAYGCP